VTALVICGALVFVGMACILLGVALLDTSDWAAPLFFGGSILAVLSMAGALLALGFVLNERF